MSTINKTELARRTAEATGLNLTVTDEVITVFLDKLQGAVAEGDKVTLTGFATFEARKRDARTARNPRTGEEIQVAPTTVPAFKAGTVFRKRVNDGA